MKKTSKMDDLYDPNEDTFEVDPALLLLNEVNGCSSSASSSHSKPPKLPDNDKYIVLSTDEIVQYVGDFVQEVNNIIQVKANN